MYDVVTFGEAMVRLSPPNFQKMEEGRKIVHPFVGGGGTSVEA